MKKKIVLSLIISLIVTNSMMSVYAKDESYKKEETVKIQCDEYGQVEKINVEDLLKIKDDKMKIIDYSKLNEIKNIQGDEEFSLEKDGTLIWENHGEDISYKGETDIPLPVDVKVSYYLDGHKVKSEDLLGKSGHVKIRFDYINHENKTINIDGKKYDVHVPLLCASALMLPNDHFDNVQVSNGKILENQDQSIVVGMSMPSIKDDLKLIDVKEMKDVDLPDFVEVSADVQDFELELTATVVSTIGLSDISELNDIDQLVDSMNELSLASTRILNATHDLSEGINLMNRYLNQYFYGVSALEQGLINMEDSLKILKTNKQGIDQGVNEISTSLKSLNKLIEEVSVLDKEELYEAVKSLIEDMRGYLDKVSSLNDDLEKVDQLIKDVEQYNTLLKSYSQTLKDEIDKIDILQIEEDATLQAQKQMKEIIDQSNISQSEKEQMLNEVKNIKINGITSKVSSQLEEIKEKIDQQPKLEVPQFNQIDLSEFEEIIKDIQKQKDIISSYDSILNEFEDIESFVNNLSNQLENASSLISGISLLSQSIDQMYDVTHQLSIGASGLTKNQESLKQGMNSLSDGANVLASGYQSFDENGISRLTEIADDDLKEVLARFKAIQKAESEYYNYSGINEECEGSVVFIYETDEIKK